MLRGVNKTHYIPYRPQGNGVVERNDRTLVDSLCALLDGRDQKNLNLLLVDIMAVHRVTSHTQPPGKPQTTSRWAEKGNFVLIHKITAEATSDRHIYAVALEGHLGIAHNTLRNKRWNVRTKDQNKPLKFPTGDMVL